MGGRGRGGCFHLAVQLILNNNSNISYMGTIIMSAASLRKICSNLSVVGKSCVLFDSSFSDCDDDLIGADCCWQDEALLGIQVV